MSLRNAISMGLVQSAAGMIMSFISIKVTAVYLGPAGIGTMSQLNYLISMTGGIITSGICAGLVRRVAELGAEDARRDTAISTVLKAVLAAGVLGSAIVFFGSGWFARSLLHDEALRGSIVLFSGLAIFGLFATVVMNSAIGGKDLRSLTVINVGTSFVSMLAMVVAAPLFGLVGALVASASVPAIQFVVAFIVSRGRSWWPKRVFSHPFSIGELRIAGAFIPLSVITTLGSPAIQLLIRDNVIAHAGLTAIGLLQGLGRLSDMYVGIAGTVISMYFFPRFSELKGHDEIRHELMRGVSIVAPAVGLVSLVLYLARHLIIHFVFTGEFAAMSELFGWQMAGNTIRVVSMFLMFVLLAKANPWAMALLELATCAVWWLLSIYLIPQSGALGSLQAFVVTYGIHIVVTSTAIAVMLRRMRAVGRPALVA